MTGRIRILVLALSILIVANSFADQALHLYGGENATVYLGCLNCAASHPSSIWNKRGSYGRVSSAISIWNKNKSYGSPRSEFSPWNKTADHPPIILDDAGQIYGRFTLNREKEPTNVSWAAWLLSNYEIVRLDLDTYRAKFEDG